MAYPRGNRSLARTNFIKLSLHDAETQLTEAIAEYLGEQPAVMARVAFMEYLRKVRHEMECAGQLPEKLRTQQSRI